MNIFLSKGRKEQEEIQKQSGKSLNEKVIQFVDIGVESIEEAKKLARRVNWQA